MEEEGVSHERNRSRGRGESRSRGGEGRRGEERRRSEKRATGVAGHARNGHGERRRQLREATHRLKGGAADKRAVNVGASHEVVDVRVAYAATVLDDDSVRHCLRVVVDEPRADVGVRLLRNLMKRGEETRRGEG